MLLQSYLQSASRKTENMLMSDWGANGNDRVVCFHSDASSDFLCPAPALRGDPLGLPHSSNLDLRLRTGSIQWENWAGDGRAREREIKGIKIFSESQLHVLLLGCPKASGCHHHSPLSGVLVMGPPPFLSASQSRTSLITRERRWDGSASAPSPVPSLSQAEDAVTPDSCWPLLRVTTLPVLRAESTPRPRPGP